MKENKQGAIRLNRREAINIGLGTLLISAVAATGTRAAAGTQAADEAAHWAYKQADGPHAVKTAETVVLHDANRGKDLQLRVTWPDAAGPFPVIVWSHGARGTKDMYQPLIRHWTGHGYVCIQANHSDSRAITGREGPGPNIFADWANRPKDIAFILDSLDKIEAKVPALKGKLDRKAIGVGGHSFGAHTAQLVAGATTADAGRARRDHADPRPLAFLLLSPQGIGAHSAGLDEHAWDGVTRPFIVITGTNDIGRKGDDWQWRLDPWKYAPRKDKFLLVIEEAWHGFGGVVGDTSFQGAGPENAAHCLYVKSASVAFWDAFLKQDAQAAAFLRSGAMAEKTKGEAKLSHDVPPDTGEPKPGGARAQHATTFEDATWHDAKRDRAVPVRIYAPKDAEGRFPTVVFSHGGGESREAFTYLGEHLARRGYLAVFLTHKGSDRAAIEASGKTGLAAMTALAGIDEFHLRPEDIRFVLDRLLSENPESIRVAGRVDPHRLAVAGQCAGSTTALTMVGLRVNLPEGKNVTFLDPRFKCAIALSPQPGGRSTQFGLHAQSWAKIQAPTLVVTGGRDFNWFPQVKANPKLVQLPYDGLPPGDKYLLEISDAEHNAFTDSVPYYPARERDPRHHGWICEVVTAFLDAHLKDDEAARVWLDGGELEKATKGACRQECKPFDFSAGDGEVKSQVERMFQFFDRDKDDALSKEEMPERLVRGFDAIDRDRNGKVSQDEMNVALSQYQRRRSDGREEPRREDPRREEEKPASAPSVSCADRVRLHDVERGKVLQVRATWPEQPGPCPVIVFSHRVGGARHDYRPLVEHWAEGGYVVLQADHSDSRELARSGPRLDWADRARDMSFLIDSLADIEMKVPGVKGRVDANRIGVGGHLIGAYAACVLAGQENLGATAPRNLKDDRVRAALLLSPQGRGQGLTEKSWKDLAGPLMVLSGSGIPSVRTGNPSEWRREPFTFSPPGDKYLVWIEGLDGDYAGLIQPGQGDDEKVAEWILDTTLAFWDAHLKGDEPARARLAAWPVPEVDKTRLRVECKVDASPAAPPADFNKLFAERAADYSAKHGGRAVLVMINGKSVFERYEKVFGVETATHLHSATKAFWGPVIAAMIEDGLIESFDEPAVRTLPEWQDDPRKSRITLRHLLTLSAGLVQDLRKLQGHDRPTLAPDLYKHAIGVPCIREPGAVFQYGPSCYYTLGEIMKRKLAARNETPLDYLKRRILDPIDVEVGPWVHDASGNPHIPNGAHLTARNWAKYGQWLLQGGEWNGKQIVKKDLLDELVKPSKANPGHGLALWLNHPGGQGSLSIQVAPPSAKSGFIYHDGCPDLFAALGAGKCRMYIVPSLKMVALRQADIPQDRYSDNTFLSLLLMGKAPSRDPCN
jgi:predicted dienelactone hydrolase/CubicO group peptidase (beta-lactamase class C family)